MKKKLLGIGLGLTLFLVGCGSEGALLEVGDKKLEKDDYIELLNGNMYVGDRGDLVLGYIAPDFVDKDKVEDAYEKEIELYKEYMGTEIGEDDLTQEEKDSVREWVEQDLGTKEIYKEAGIVTDKAVKEAFGDGKKMYKVSSITFSTEGKEGLDIKKVEKLLKEGKDVSKKIKKMSEEAFYDEGTEYLENDLPMEFEGVVDQKKGFTNSEDYEGYGVAYKVEEVRDATFEEAEDTLVQKLMHDSVTPSTEVLKLLEKEGKVKISPVLRGYLDFDVEQEEETDLGENGELDLEELEELEGSDK